MKSPELIAVTDNFTDLMKERLTDQEPFRGNSFIALTPTQLFQKMELKMLSMELAILRNASPETVAILAADAANYAMFTSAAYFNEPKLH